MRRINSSSRYLYDSRSLTIKDSFSILKKYLEKRNTIPLLNDKIISIISKFETILAKGVDILTFNGFQSYRWLRTKKPDSESLVELNVFDSLTKLVHVICTESVAVFAVPFIVRNEPLSEFIW